MVFTLYVSSSLDYSPHVALRVHKSAGSSNEGHRLGVEREVALQHLAMHLDDLCG
jgi:hypothetical protein